VIGEAMNLRRRSTKAPNMKNFKLLKQINNINDFY
jgi:hypothetical protein